MGGGEGVVLLEDFGGGARVVAMKSYYTGL